MDDVELIWRFGRWIARRVSGEARLGWADGAMTLRLRGGRVVAVLGLDPGELVRRLGCAPLERPDLLDQARTLATQAGVPELQAVGCAKEMIQQALQAWYRDPGRRLELAEEEPQPGDGASISTTHAIVETILNEGEQNLPSVILPDLNVLLRRSERFLELYAPLRLSEDADLIVAKITGQRTAAEIATRSPHGTDEVVRLLAALVATGMLEPVPVATPAEEVELLPATFPEDEPQRRRLSLPVVLAVAAGLVLALAVATVLLIRARDGASAQATASWGVVVDMGCEPQDLQRVLRKANQQPQILHAVKASGGEEEPCWRLVWGRFHSREQAAAAMSSIPSSIRRQGFEPHPIELEQPSETGPVRAPEE